MIQCQQVKKGYGATAVLLDVTFEIGEQERVGLIGRNGTGKTTLFQLLNGSEKPDAGQIAIKKGARIGYLEQVPHAEEAATVRDVLERAFAEPKRWQREMQELERLMSDPQASRDERQFADLLRRYGELQERFERAGGYELDARLGRVASGLGIPEAQLARPFAELSGGEKTKVGLAAMLLEEPDVLLLDEPTNHLDMHAIEWLEQFLQSYSGTVVVISHDRYFLDRVVTKIIELEDGEAITYYTNYSDYQKEKEARLLQQFADYKEQQKKIKKMKESIKQLIEWANRANPPNPGLYRRAASMQKALDRMVKLKRPIMERRAMELDLNQRDRSGVQVVTLDRVGKSYDDRTLFSGASELLRYGERVALLGANGSGKSTLLKCILGEIAPDAGEVKLGSRVAVGYLAQEAAPEDEGATVLAYYRDAVGMEEGEARGRLARFLFCGADVFKSVRSLSGGEWSRLRFALLMHEQPNLLVLDEPTNHLDIDSREALEEALEDFPGTVLAVSHDRYFINRIAHKIWALENGSLISTPGGFEHYKEKQQMLLASAPAVAPEPRLKADSAQVGQVQGHSTRDGVNLERLEQEISELEHQLRSIDETMMEPANAASPDKLATLYEERELLQAKLNSLYEKWMESSTSS
ncbi:ribosomal protection-like ABC-F family protein [Paenibacillus marinisediminis]